DPGTIFIPGKGQIPDRTLPYGRMYAVWSTFLGKTANSSAIKLVSSIDGGNTWTTPNTKLSLGGLVQGASVVVDPLSGAVLIFWRQFKDQARPDAIMGAVSIDKGKGFSAPFTVALIDPFDQLTNLGAAPAIRITTYPTVSISVQHTDPDPSK